MATPHVSGAAALMKSLDPSLDWRALKNRILAGGDSDPNLQQTLTGKRLNVYGAMTCTNSEILARVAPRSDVITSAVGAHLTVSMLHINCGDPAGPVTVSVAPTGDVINLADDGVGPDIGAGDGIYSADFIVPSAGTYTLTFADGESMQVRALRPYKFEKITSQYVAFAGTNLSLEDEETKRIDLPFPIHFGGQTFDHLFVSDNGIISMDHAYDFPVGLPMPYPNVTSVVAPFWDDLDPQFPSDHNVYWGVAGTAPARQLVIEWRSIPHYGFYTLGDPLVQPGIVFEVVFSEATDDVYFNYSNVYFDYFSSYASQGATALVGMQVGPTEGTMFSSYAPALDNGTSLKWTLADHDFVMTVPATTVTTFAGQNAEFSGTIKALYGLEGSVTISCGAGAPTTCGSATVTADPTGTPFSVNVGDTTTGDYSFDLSAQSVPGTPVSHIQPVTLKVVDIAVAQPSPSSLTIADGGSASTDLSVTATGSFSGDVKLSCSGLPAGAACSFSNPVVRPKSSAAASSVLTLSLAPQTSAGLQHITISASTDGLASPRTVDLPITIVANSDFFFSPLSNIASDAGQAIAVNLGIDQQDGYSGAVTLTCSVVPAGPGCSVPAGAISAFPATVAVTLGPGTAPSGYYDVTITGSDGTRTHSVKTQLRILNYAVSHPSALQIFRTVQWYFRIDINSVNSFTGDLLLSCNDSSGAYCSVNPSQVHVSPGSTITAYGFVIDYTSVSSSDVTISIQPVGGGPVRNLVIPVSNQGFTVTPGTRTEQTVLAGQTSAPFDLTVAGYNGFSYPIKLAPWSWVGNVSFSPSSTLTPDGTQQPVTFTIGIPEQDSSIGGTFTIGIMGTSEPQIGQTLQVGTFDAFKLHVQDYALLFPSAAVPYVLATDPGGAATTILTLKEFEGLAVPVQLSCDPDIGPGITCSLGKATLNPGETGTVTVQTSPDTPSGGRYVTVNAIADVGGKQLKHAVHFFLSIGNFSLTLWSPSLTGRIGEDTYAVYDINSNVLTDGHTAAVSCSSPDPGITCEHLLNTIAPGTSYVTLRPTPGVTTVGSHSFTVSVTIGSETHSATGTLNVQGQDSLMLRSPNGYELWSSGTKEIVWDYSGNVGSSVKLELLNRGVFDRVIAENVPVGIDGKGSYKWTINVPFSQFYQVRVSSSANPAINDISDRRVWIGAGVDINSPKTGDTYFPTDYLTVYYTWSMIKPTRFDLYKGGKLYKMMQDGVASGYLDSPGWYWATTGSLNDSMPDGNDYTAVLTLTDGSQITSGAFSIIHTGITAVTPAEGEIFKPGSQIPITWTYRGDPGRDVSITLNNNGYTDRVLMHSVPIGANGSGSYLWTIPTDLPSSKLYSITIAAYNWHPFAATTPGNFAVGDFHSLSVNVAGQGFVNTSDYALNCPGTCTQTFTSGSSVTLSANPASGSRFTGWSGACSGSSPSCTVTMNSDQSITANFEAVSFGLSATPSSATISAGGKATYTITASGSTGFNSQIILSCSGLPAGATCTFSPSSLTPGSGSQNSTLSISTSVAQQASLLDVRYFWLAFALLGLMVFRFEKPINRAALLLVVIALSIPMISCGGGGGGTTSRLPSGTGGTPSGTYTVTITGDTGVIRQSTTVTLKIQ